MKEIILAEVSPKSVGGKSLFESSGKITSENVSDFHSELSIIEQAMKELSKLGFRVVRQGMITFTISGPMDLFESILGTKLQKRTKEVFPSPLTPDEKRKTRKSEEEPPEVPKASYWEGSDGTKVFDPPKGLRILLKA